METTIIIQNRSGKNIQTISSENYSILPGILASYTLINAVSGGNLSHKIIFLTIDADEISVPAPKHETRFAMFNAEGTRLWQYPVFKTIQEASGFMLRTPCVMQVREVEIW